MEHDDLGRTGADADQFSAGNASAAIGAIGLTAATVMLVDPQSSMAALGVFALIGFHLIAGWKTYRLAASRMRR